MKTPPLQSMLMSKFFSVICVIFLSLSIFKPIAADGANFPDETLNYSIEYKWGLIQKETATATLSLRSSGNNYILRLTAKTLPWADRFFPIRDTLQSVVTKMDLSPKSYTKISHEDHYYMKDVLNFTNLTNSRQAKVHRIIVDKKGKREEKSLTLSAIGTGYDMLSVFYYLRILDFEKLISGKVTKVNIFSGEEVETLKIKGLGKETITLPNKTKRQAYKISFSFTTGGGRKSSEDIVAWISADSRHIPLRLIGKLPVGEVRVNLK